MTKPSGSNQYQSRAASPSAVASVLGAILLRQTAKATIMQAADWWAVSHDSDTSVDEFLGRVRYLMRQQEAPVMHITLVHPDGMRTEAEMVRARRSRLWGWARQRLSVTYYKDDRPMRSWRYVPPRLLLRRISAIATHNPVSGMTMTITQPDGSRTEATLSTAP
jgi:hypothetical protein